MKGLQHINKPFPGGSCGRAAGGGGQAEKGAGADPQGAEGDSQSAQGGKCKLFLLIRPSVSVSVCILEL